MSNKSLKKYYILFYLYEVHNDPLSDKSPD